MKHVSKVTRVSRVALATSPLQTKFDTILAVFDDVLLAIRQIPWGIHIWGGGGGTTTGGTTGGGTTPGL